MLANVNPGSNNKGIHVPPRPGASRILVQNPASSSVTVYLNQGFDLEYGEVAAGSLDLPSTPLTVVDESTAETGALDPGESVILNTGRGVWIHTGPGNVPAQVNITFLA